MDDNTTPIDIHVGIVTYNSLHDLPRCIAAIQQQTFQPLHITIFDNASTDGTTEWLHQHTHDNITVLFNNTNIGYGAAHNRILAHITPAPNDFYLTLNPDAILQPDYIEQLLQAAHKYDAQWLTGKLLLTNDTGTPTGNIYSVGHALRRDGYAFNIGYGMPDNGQYSADREVFGVPGAAAFYSSSLLLDGVLFDEHMFMYNEDTDVDWRAQRQGLRCYYCAQAVAWHHGSTATGTLRMYALANRYRSVIKHAFWVDLITFNIPLMLIHLLLRLMVSPRLGWKLLRMVFAGLPNALQQRQAPTINRRDIHQWFAWSTQQATSVPTSWTKRFQQLISTSLRQDQQAKR